VNHLLSFPLRLWRHPNGKPLYLIGAALGALYAGWVFTFMILTFLAYNAYVLFDD